MPSLLDHLLQNPLDRRSSDSLGAFSRLTAHVAPLDFALTIDRAAAFGFAADRLGYAFAGGYRAALARLVPTITGTAALCATEDRGAHPRFIKTTLSSEGEGYRLTGTKAWVTLGTEAEELLVVASIGADDAGRNRLKVVRLPSHRPGIAFHPRPETPFAPEIPHAEARFENVVVDASEILPGDGYAAYLKPFRTIEDAHVLAATLGYLVAVARASSWPHAWIEQAIALLLALREIGAADPSSPAMHIALSGAFAWMRRLSADAEPYWASADEAERARWDRDKPLLEVAEKARATRIETAWKNTLAAT